jgi:aspartate aminotransferase
MNLPIRHQIEILEDSKIVDVWARGFSTPGAIMLAVGEGDLPTPKFICDAAYRSMLAGETFYAPKRGLPELHTALSAYYKRHWNVDIEEDRIAVTSAGMNAMIIAMQIALNAGDNMAAVAPVWPNIFATAEIMGAEVRKIAMNNDGHRWNLDLDKLFAACDARTKVIYAASPGNPSGWIMPAEQMQAVVEFCRRKNIWFVADEVYSRLIYDRPVAPSVLQFAKPDDPVIAVNSFSKTWAMTGWRLGWMVVPAKLIPVIERLIEFNTSGGQAFLQRGGLAAVLEGESFVGEQIERFRAGRDLVTQRLGGMKRVKLTRSEAAFYLMFQVDGEPDSYKLAMKLMDQARVGLAPGVAFGTAGEGFLRLCFASSTKLLGEAMDRLEPFLN